MNAFWADESWRYVAYESEETLFGPEPNKTDNETIASAFRQRLKTVGQFKNVPEPLPMRNSMGAVVYYLYFASQNSAGNTIVTDIFAKFRR